jgi:plastocyanin
MRNRFVLLALILPVVGACSSDSASDASSPPAATTQSTSVADAVTTTTAVVAPTPTEVVPTDASGTTPATAGAVGIADFKFDPATINVPVGGSVVWTNNDPQQHTATSAGNFDAGAIQPGSSMTVEFPTAGSFAYICSFHPFMTGTVVVA